GDRSFGQQRRPDRLRGFLGRLKTQPFRSGDPHVQQAWPGLSETPLESLIQAPDIIDQSRWQSLGFCQLDEVDTREVAAGNVVHAELPGKAGEGGVARIVENYEARVRLLLARRKESLDGIHRRAVAQDCNDLVDLAERDTDGAGERITKTAAGAGVEAAFPDDRQRVVL